MCWLFLNVISVPVDCLFTCIRAGRGKKINLLTMQSQPQKLLDKNICLKTVSSKNNKRGIIIKQFLCSPQPCLVHVYHTNICCKHTQWIYGTIFILADKDYGERQTMPKVWRHLKFNKGESKMRCNYFKTDRAWIKTQRYLKMGSSCSEALDLPVDLRSHPHLWSWAVGRDQKNEKTATSSRYEFRSPFRRHFPGWPSEQPLTAMRSNETGTSMEIFPLKRVIMLIH